MNCTTCRYELSQCLDGRLPSGRRTEVMNHAESCATCGSFWLELQAAQRLTLSLRQEEVGTDFREQLWERIHAGEGTPSAVFQEPVPLLSKMRYALTGAAAAAALLIGISYLHNNSDSLGTPSTGDPSTNSIAALDKQTDQQHNPSNTGNQIPAGGDVAQIPQPIPRADLAANGNINTLHGTLEPRRLPETPSMFKVLSYESVAKETTRQFEDRYTSAAHGLRNLNNPAFDSNVAINEILRSAREMRAFGQLLLDLREQQALRFDNAEVGYQLSSAVKHLSQVSRYKSPDARTVEALISPILSEHRLGKISKSYMIKPLRQQEQQHHLMVLNALRPEVFAKLFTVVGNGQQTHGRFQIRPNVTFWMSTDCEPILVAPRSELQKR